MASIVQTIFSNAWFHCSLIKILLKFVSKAQINDRPALVQTMARNHKPFYYNDVLLYSLIDVLLGLNELKRRTGFNKMMSYILNWNSYRFEMSFCHPVVNAMLFNEHI